MAGGNSIKLFQFNEKLCQTLGIFAVKFNSNRHKSNAINVIFAICLTHFAMTSVAFLFYDAKSMDDYGVAILELNCITVALAYYFVSIWKMEDCLKSIENCEQFIETSKLKILPI